MVVIAEDGQGGAERAREAGSETSPAHPDAVSDLTEELRIKHPDDFGGLWRDGDRLVIAVVSDEAVLRATVESVFAEPELISYVSADYSEAHLDQAMSRLNDVFPRLVDEHDVYALGVDVKENRVFLEVERPEAVEVAAYVPEELAAMVTVRQGRPARTLGGEPIEAEQQRSRSGWEPLAALGTAAVAAVLAVGYRRRSRRLAARG